MKHFNNLLKLLGNLQFIKITILTLTAVISAGWFGDALKGDCLFTQIHSINTCGKAGYFLSLIFSFLIFIVFTGFLYITSQQLFYRNLKWVEGVRPHRVLIIAVSALKTRLDEKDGDIYLCGGEKIKEKRIKLTGNISQDIEAFTQIDFTVNTQQFLRAVKPHIENHILERVFLIGSEGAEGSAKKFQEVKKILLLYKNNLEIETYGNEVNGIRFEDVEELCEAYENLIKQAKDKNYTENDIILDVTGGQKTASIAAAMTTFRHRNLKFQYVETGENNAVLTFNIEIGSASRIL
ncbi:hypothetical protein [Nitrosomonas sp.]|uniref:hypothetical protein n=1 Tax=Nitrosomonas sp. TaxID=42353 RepID=UPI0020810E59|nr:hypothetical protein [Nitrosomonas sp.]GJL77001.1 MAG: hypothetical protein NMNS02_31070 [Nitrosomonas sp.]